MRLINVHTLDFEEFEGQKVPQYAILSHRWEDEEVLFEHTTDGSADQKKGAVKIKSCCHQARRDSIQYVWVDTCCIDKSSSAELSEAINTMFRWYQNAKVCYVYLSDVDATADDSHFERIFKKSVWFTRGWTLQELIAPNSTLFFNSHWVYIGSLHDLRLQDLVVDVTSIPSMVLSHEWPLSNLPIAQRMSWAANRRTTRVEDRAYSLMGIFDINMPMLYGEGENAFRRLQEEIVRRSNDRSVLLFQDKNPTLLASSPSAFGVLRVPSIRGWNDRLRRIWPHVPYDRSLEDSVTYMQYSEDEASTMTNVGLSISLPLLPWFYNTYIALVASFYPDSSPPLLCFIYLRPGFPSSSKMVRISCNNESVKCISEEGYKRLYNKDTVDRDWLAHHTRRVTIAFERRFHDLMEVGPESRGDIILNFERNLVWGIDGHPKPANVISRSKWEDHPRVTGNWQKAPMDQQKLHLAMPYELLVIIQVHSFAGRKGYLYITHDENFDLHVVYEKRNGIDQDYFDSTPGDEVIYDIGSRLDATSFWTRVKNSDDDEKYQVIKEYRSPNRKRVTTIPDLDMEVTIHEDGHFRGPLARPPHQDLNFCRRIDFKNLGEFSAKSTAAIKASNS